MKTPFEEPNKLLKQAKNLALEELEFHVQTLLHEVFCFESFTIWPKRGPCLVGYSGNPYDLGNEKFWCFPPAETKLVKDFLILLDKNKKIIDLFPDLEISRDASYFKK